MIVPSRSLCPTLYSRSYNRFDLSTMRPLRSFSRHRMVVLAMMACTGCSRPSQLVAPTLVFPLHLEDHLDLATRQGGHTLSAAPALLKWPDGDFQAWALARPWGSGYLPAVQQNSGSVLRLSLPKGKRDAEHFVGGGVFVAVQDRDWSEVVVRARTSSVEQIQVGFNLKSLAGSRATRAEDEPHPFVQIVAETPLVRDGAIVTYRLTLARVGKPSGPWMHLGLWFRSREAGSVDLLSVSLRETSSRFGEASIGLSTLSLSGETRRALFAATPSRLTYTVRLPHHAQLCVALGLGNPVDDIEFRVTVQAPGGSPRVLLRESHSRRGEWIPRTVSLGEFAGRTVSLTFEAHSKNARHGDIALWGSPTIVTASSTKRPNVIIYVIDGASVERMSLYGSKHRTTPHLEDIAAEGAVFERAYAPSSWTKPSTTSFMTSLHNSVLRLRNRWDALPQLARTMAELFHDAGYVTGLFTSNPWAGVASGLERGVDMTRRTGVSNGFTASRELQDDFWRWRASVPGRPFWAHLQTTDAHVDSPWLPVPPFDGLFQPPRTAGRIRAPSPHLASPAGTLVKYDQALAHNDFQLGQLVARLKTSGEWQNTLLIVTSDHGISQTGADPDRTDDLFGRWRPMFHPAVGRVPFVVVWPGTITPGTRYSQPVSLIDLLPTVLELARLKPLQPVQGASLGPLLRGEERNDFSRAVYLELFEGGLGWQEVIDGEWALSARTDEPRAAWPWPAFLYNLRTDPRCERPISDRPDLTRVYLKLLHAHMEDDRTLGEGLRADGGRIALTPEQLERLRSLGYIR